MKDDIIMGGICEGMRVHDPDILALPPDVRKRILKVMARVSEQSYRRGVQQGAQIKEELGLTDEQLFSFRYRTSLDNAPQADIRGFASGGKSADRLDIECGGALRLWGLTD